MKRHLARALAVSLLAGGLWAQPGLAQAPAKAPAAGVAYLPQRLAEGPWSIHVLKLDLRTGFRFHAALGKDRVRGLSPRTRN